MDAVILVAEVRRRITTVINLVHKFCCRGKGTPDIASKSELLPLDLSPQTITGGQATVSFKPVERSVSITSSSSSWSVDCSFKDDSKRSVAMIVVRDYHILNVCCWKVMCLKVNYLSRGWLRWKVLSGWGTYTFLDLHGYWLRRARSFHIELTSLKKLLPIVWE
jgi:hypothetical protein